jgi:GxxExxY protein
MSVAGEPIPIPPRIEAQLYLADEVFRIQGAAYAVGNALGPGFLEGVYHERLALEFAALGIPYRSQPQLQVTYRGVRLTHTYAPDFVCFGAVIVEIKALRALAPEHRAQTLNYLKASGLKVGLLINFGVGPRLQIERFVF